jgi:hypothetical protein
MEDSFVTFFLEFSGLAGAVAENCVSLLPKLNIISLKIIPAC